MPATLISYGSGYIARCGDRQWAAIRPTDRGSDLYEADAVPGGRIVHASPQVVADDTRTVVFPSRVAAIASLVEHGVEAAPAHRPRRDPSAARVVRSYRLHPDTIAKIDAEAKRSGESAGQVIDRLVAGLG